MNCVGFYHAIILSPTAYARHLYPSNINEDSNYWKHEDAARHMANQLMNKFPKLAVLGSPSSDLLPPNLWKDPVRITATLFSQASRIVVLVPSDCAEHIADFATNYLGPLLSRPKNEGGKPEWHSRFIAAAIGGVSIPIQLTPEIPFIKTVHFRELAWFRDISAMMLMEDAIKDFWVPAMTGPSSNSKDFIDAGTSRIGRVYGPLVSKAGYSLNECVETTSVIGFSTHVTGKLDLPEDISSKSINKSNASSPERRLSRKNRSQSSTRHSTRSRSRMLKPEFEAREAEQRELKTIVKGDVGQVIPMHIDKRSENGVPKSTLNGSENKNMNGFHTPTKVDDYSKKVVDQVEDAQRRQLFSDKVTDYIDEPEKMKVEKPLDVSNNRINSPNESAKEPEELLLPKYDDTQNETKQNEQTSPRVYKSGKKAFIREPKAPLASTSIDDDDIHLKQDLDNQHDKTDLSQEKSPRMKSQTSYVKRVVTQEHTYSTYTTSERTETGRSPSGLVDQKTSSSLNKQTVSPMTPTSYTLKPTLRSTSPQDTTSPSEKTGPSTLVSSSPSRIVTTLQDPPPKGIVEEVTKRQPVHVITARRIHRDSTDAPVLRPATPPVSKQFTRTISVRNLSVSKPSSKETNSPPRSVSVSNLHTEPPSSPRVTATPKTFTNHLIKVRSKSVVENCHTKIVCDSGTEMRAPLATGELVRTGVVCHAERGTNYPKANQTTTSEDCVITKDESLWTGPDAGELYRLELMLNNANIRTVCTSGFDKASAFVQEVKNIERSVQRNQTAVQDGSVVVEQGASGSSGTDLWRIMLIYLTAFLTLLLSLIIAYFLIGNTNCDSTPNPSAS